MRIDLKRNVCLPKTNKTKDIYLDKSSWKQNREHSFFFARCDQPVSFYSSSLSHQILKLHETYPQKPRYQPTLLFALEICSIYSMHNNHNKGMK